ncbi:response regulator [Nocardia huaxiensis]|uniref:Response regulator transcription factor n=1 Tax=Nocardia huaxiensis TaxID=2755382 RepID=A0A7D6Z7Q8_9NOCA|nr:response regulator transcription factor [Nocardia huaxiensis]QLY29028.1 response regulator transcription factor [Nocardia huaxiensis]UFS97488.1 response regulator transcription factor [Nocardia huaxiensis]
MTADVQVWIVDDRPAFRRVAAAMISVSAGFTVAGEAASGEDAVELIRTRFGDETGLILMDINMPGIGGIEATRRIRDRHPELAVVLMSTYDTSDLPEEVSQCGAAGYVHKEALTPQLLTRLWRDLSPPTAPFRFRTPPL